MVQSIYDFSCTTVNGERLPLSRFRGDVVLIVNTASYCGFTPQFKGLEYLYKRYRNQGFVVLGFPCNQFAQEPKSNENISDFCVRNYGVTFPMCAKVRVNGPDADPLFKFLKHSAPGFLGTQAIKWNFTKFLINREGQVLSRYGTAVLPSLLAKQIEPLLDGQHKKAS